MNFKRILCPVDYSEFSAAANEYASVLAQSTGAEIVYLNAVFPEAPFGSYEYFRPESEKKRDCENLKDQFQPTVEGVASRHVVEFGRPAEEIIKYANENEVDLIVLGTHGRSGLRRMLMGSVAEEVVRNAECPVLAIKADTRVLQTK